MKRFLLILAGAMAPAVSRTSGPSAQAQTTGADDPLRLFSRMVPVFTHPRCVNCHGATDPVSGTNHGGGPVDEAADCEGLDGSLHPVKVTTSWNIRYRQ